MKRKQRTEIEKAAILKFVQEHGSTAAMKKFKVSSSMLSNWRKKTSAPKEPKSEAGTHVRDAIVLLELMEKTITKQIRELRIKKPDAAHLLGLTALATLRGEL